MLRIVHLIISDVQLFLSRSGIISRPVAGGFG